METGNLAMPVIEHGVDVGRFFARGAVGKNGRTRPLMCSVKPLKPGTARFVREHGRGSGEDNVAIYLVSPVAGETAA